MLKSAERDLQMCWDAGVSGSRMVVVVKVLARGDASKGCVSTWSPAGPAAASFLSTMSRLKQGNRTPWARQPCNELDRTLGEIEP